MQLAVKIPEGLMDRLRSGALDVLFGPIREHSSQTGPVARLRRRFARVPFLPIPARERERGCETV